MIERLGSSEKAGKGERTGREVEGEGEEIGSSLSEEACEDPVPPLFQSSVKRSARQSRGG